MLERHKYASGKAHLQDVVWRNFEDEDKVKGCLPDDSMLKSLILAVGGEYVEDSYNVPNFPDSTAVPRGYAILSRT